MEEEIADKDRIEREKEDRKKEEKKREKRMKKEDQDGGGTAPRKQQDKKQNLDEQEPMICTCRRTPKHRETSYHSDK